MLTKMKNVFIANRWQSVRKILEERVSSTSVNKHLQLFINRILTFELEFEFCINVILNEQIFGAKSSPLD